MTTGLRPVSGVKTNKIVAELTARRAERKNTMKKITVATKDYMTRHYDENLAWCRPYRSENGRVALSVCEGVLSGLEIDGQEIDVFDPHDKAREDLWEKVARAAVTDKDELTLFNGYSWSEIVLQNYVVECGCSTCPWFEQCYAMYEDMEVVGNEADDYTDDEIIDASDDEDEG